MADRVEWFPITVPANTPQIAPVTTPMVFNQGTVLEIDVKIPPGPAGNVGFQIFAGGSQYLPRTIGNFIFPDDDYLTWVVKDAINSGSFALVAFNTDVWPHLIEVSFQVDEIVFAPSPFSSLPVSL